MQLFIWMTEWYLTITNPASLHRDYKALISPTIKDIPYTYHVLKEILPHSTNSTKVNSAKAELRLMDQDSTNLGWSNSSALSECVTLGKTFHLFNFQFK